MNNRIQHSIKFKISEDNREILPIFVVALLKHGRIELHLHIIVFKKFFSVHINKYHFDQVDLFKCFMIFLSKQMKKTCTPIHACVQKLRCYHVRLCSHFCMK